MDQILGVAFDGMAAFNQVGFLFGGALCLFLGLAIIGSILYKKRTALKVTGTIVGVRKKDNTYFAVYNYIMPDGTTHEAVSDSGSSMTDDKATGSTVDLLVSPDTPDRPTPAKAGFWVWFMVAVLSGTGLIFCSIAIMAFPTTRMTWVMLAALVGYGVFKISKIIIPKDKRQSTSDWRQSREADRKKEMEALPFAPIETFTNTPAYIEAQQKNADSKRKTAPFLIAFGIAAICLGLFLGHKNYNLERYGIRTSGTVVSIDSKSDSDGTTMYYPVVRFTDAKGFEVQFKSKTGSSVSFHTVGEPVKVMYDAENPAQNAQIDSGLLNWLPAFLVTGLGLLLLAGGIHFRRRV